VLALVALAVGSIAVATPASAAKKKSKPVVLATATGWLDVATAAKLTAAGAPQQITDTSSPNLAQMSALLSGLAFKGLGTASYARTQADPSDPSAPIGNYILKVVVFGSVFVPYFMEGPIETYTDLLHNNNARDIWFRKTMCEHGIFMLPTAIKRNHVSAAHTEADIDRTLETARDVLRHLPAA